MALTPAYAVDGGRVPAAMLRMTLWASTSGASGIVTADDLRVSALATPGAAVNIGPGGALMANRYKDVGETQTYAALNDASDTLAIPATTSGSGRTDYVILRVNDWHFDGSQQPAEPLTALYCSFALVSSLEGLAFPYVPLAKITIPSSTATITNAMITDLRTVANPRTHTVVLPIPAVTEDTGMSLTVKTEPGEYFPNGLENTLGPADVDIPTWATRAQVLCTWTGVKYDGGGEPFGRYWVEYGTKTGNSTRERHTQRFRFDSGGGNNERVNWILGDDVYIPKAYRGTRQRFAPKAILDGNTGVSMDKRSGMIWQIRFVEVADDEIR